MRNNKHLIISVIIATIALIWIMVKLSYENSNAITYITHQHNFLIRTKKSL